jgi:hypothetical protein
MLKNKKVKYEFENETLSVFCDDENITITRLIETGGGNCDIERVRIDIKQVACLLDGLNLVANHYMVE